MENICSRYLVIAFIILIIVAMLSGCIEDRDYRQDMREFVQSISSYSKEINPDFIIIPQNGQELITLNGESEGALSTSYINAIDGIGREDLFYGYYGDNIPTPNTDTDYMLDFLNLAKKNNIQVLVTDYCWTHSFVDNSYYQNNNRNFISFAASHRELDNIPNYPNIPYNQNNNDIFSLNDAKNFLYLINPDSFSNKDQFSITLKQTNYDILIIDLFYNEAELNESVVNSLKIKDNGGKRLVVAYMSIGEAEDYRYYWNDKWYNNPPSWLLDENPDWPGNYKVQYWDSNWQDIIYGNNDSYLYKILNAGFDGVYLDLVDAYEYFED